ncbi:hypothetical protein ABE10_00965, partial [Bacillus toyonensis]|nr:hypothetical protein [Bacillus toyonensis]
RGPESEQRRAVGALGSVVVLDVRPVPHDVVTVGVAGRVHVADAHVPLLDLAGAAEHELVDDHRGGLSRGEPAVHLVVPVDEEARVGQPDPLHDRAVDEHALEAAAVHLLESGGVEAGRRERDGDAHPLRDAVLPVEGAAVVVVAAALDALEAGGPAAHPGEAVGKHLDVVVHEPDPLGAEVVGRAHALAEASRAAGVGVQASVDDLGAEVGAQRVDDLGGVVRGGIVDHDDPA